MTNYPGTPENQVRLVSLRRSATFTVEMSERAIEALRMINQYGIDSLRQAVAKLSPREAEEHGEGLKDLVALGGACAAALERLSDARDVIDGRKIAKNREPAPAANTGCTPAQGATL